MTTPNFGWPLIQPTDLVTDLPADFEAFADAVDADLNGLNGGTTGQVLTKASATDYDFAFADAGGGGAGFTLLNTGGTALTGATTITVSGISNQERLLVVIQDASSVNASSNMTVRFNSDSGNNYQLAGLEIISSATYQTNFISGVTGLTSQFEVGRMGDNAARSVYASVLLEGGKSTNGKSVVVSGTGLAGLGTGNTAKIYNGLYLGTSAISSVSIISSTGNFDNGTIFVYGSSN
jgi:hypothetical protein